MTALILATLLAGSADDGPTSPVFSEDVARSVLARHGLMDLEALIARASRLDDNGYLDRAELEAAAATLEAPADVVLQPEARSARLSPGDWDDLQSHRVRARRFGIAATVLMGLGAAAAVGGGIYFSLPAEPCRSSGFLSCFGYVAPTHLAGGVLFLVGGVLGAVALNLAIVAIIYLVKTYLGQRQADAPASMSALRDVGTRTTALGFRGDRRLENRRAAVEESSRSQAVLALFCSRGLSF